MKFNFKFQLTFLWSCNFTVMVSQAKALCSNQTRYIYTAGTKLGIYLVLMAALTIVFRNNFAIKLLTNISINGFIMICVKFGFGCSSRIN